MQHRIDRLIFGDNQFFGINHMSEEKARLQSMRFQDTGAICDVIACAYDEGIRTFMCTTHDRIAEVCDHVRGNRTRYTDLVFYPCMPYAHKYANAAAEEGIIGAVKRFIPQKGALNAMIRSGMSLASKDIEGITTLLIDSEMKMFQGLNHPVIFLQNVIVDFLLGIGVKDAFRIFAKHVRDRYGAEPGFITMNLPRLLVLLNEIGIENPIVCANMNKIGFRMSGGIEEYQQVLRERSARLIAMSVFASGAISANDAIEWICGQQGVASIVFGASSKRNIQSTKSLVSQYWT